MHEIDAFTNIDDNQVVRCRRRRRILLFFGALGLAAVGAACGPPPPPPPPPPAPVVSSISPHAGPLGGNNPVTITGSNFTGADKVLFGTKTARFRVNSNTKITAFPPANSAGIVEVRVSHSGVVSSNNGANDDYEYAPAPTLTNLSDHVDAEAGGASVTITGTNFKGTLYNTLAVFFGQFQATSFTVDSPTQITVEVPPGTGNVNVVVVTDGGFTANTPDDDFTYAPIPAVTQVSPSAGPDQGGNQVTITGSGFSGNGFEATDVRFGAIAATSFNVDSATQITATAPAGSGAVNVTVTTEGGTSPTPDPFNYAYAPDPDVSSINPVVGPQSGGTSVTITGSNFSGAGFTTTSVTFGSNPASSFTVDSSTQITAVAPAGTGTVTLTVTTPGGSDTATYNYAPPPTVSSLLPSTGPTGTTVVITGTNFQGAGFTNADVHVFFGGVEATTFTVLGPTTISVTVPAGTGTVDVRVTTPGGTSANTSADNYTYI